MKRLIQSILSVVMLLIIFGCSKPEPPLKPPLETVKIVFIGTTDEVGMINDYTIIEFPDGTRERRSFHIGKVGTTFKARKQQ